MLSMGNTNLVFFPKQVTVNDTYIFEYRIFNYSGSGTKDIIKEFSLSGNQCSYYSYELVYDSTVTFNRSDDSASQQNMPITMITF